MCCFCVASNRVGTGFLSDSGARHRGPTQPADRVASTGYWRFAGPSGLKISRSIQLFGLKIGPNFDLNPLFVSTGFRFVIY